MPVYTIVTANGKPAVLLNIFRQPDSNTVAVADAVDQQLTEIKKILPPGVKLQPYYDQSLLVRASIASVRDAILGLASFWSYAPLFSSYFYGTGAVQSWPVW